MDLNLAQVLVQNRVNLALPMLPDVLKRTGVTTRKMSPDMLMSVNIYSPHGRYDQLYLSNYALMRMRDEIAPPAGRQRHHIMGQRDYSMRIWLDPDELAARSLTAGDVVNAIREQNMQVASGRIGQEPVRPGRRRKSRCRRSAGSTSRNSSPTSFSARPPTAGMTRLRDVGRVELGARNEDVSCKLDGYPSAGLFIVQLPDANALDVAERVRAKMDELAKDFPDDLTYGILFDTTPYTSECIDEVFKALRDAVLLVAFVVLLFLQNWRSAVIPLIAVPVAIVGTFAVLFSFGFSLNNLTLFGLVLAIGIVVDDAIVVVEAVEHHIEQGLAPRDATIKAMSQVSGPVIAVGLVLSAVFVPCAFISGLTGQFFRQFALTIAASTIISTFNSLTLSPALSAAAAARARQGDARGVAAAGVSAARRLAGLRVARAAAEAVAGTTLAAASGRPLAADRAGDGLDRRRRGGGRRSDRRLAGRPARRHGVAERLPLVQRRRRLDHERLHPRRRRSAAGQRDRVGDLRRAVVCHLQGLYLRAEGIHPVAGHGLPVCTVQLPDAASIERTRAAVDHVSESRWV